MKRRAWLVDLKHLQNDVHRRSKAEEDTAWRTQSRRRVERSGKGYKGYVCATLFVQQYWCCFVACSSRDCAVCSMHNIGKPACKTGMCAHAAGASANKA